MVTYSQRDGEALEIPGLNTMRFGKKITAFLHDTSGTTAVEYCVMLAMILLAIIIGLTAAGNGVLDWWSNINSELSTNGF